MATRVVARTDITHTHTRRHRLRERDVGIFGHWALAFWKDTSIEHVYIIFYTYNSHTEEAASFCSFYPFSKKKNPR